MQRAGNEYLAKRSGAQMNQRQRRADSDMRYLGWAWRQGFDGPWQTPTAPSFWDQIRERIRSIPHQADPERVITLHTRWLAVAAQDRYDAVVLKLHYRDEYEFEDRDVLGALDRFAAV